MKRFRLIGVALLALFALGAVASSAGAETAPSFTVNGTRLIAGKTHNIQARVFSGHSFILTNSTQSVVITCTKFTLETGVLLGSNPGLPGKDNEVVVFSGCTLAGNGTECKLESEIIKTEPLVSEQVESLVNTKEGGKQLLEEFRPAKPANGFVTLKFSGAGCTVSETIVSGSVAAESLEDPSEGKVELGQTPHESTSWLVKFPTTPIRRVWLIAGTGGKEQKNRSDIVRY